MNEIDIKQESYFPLNFKIFGGIIIFGSLLFSISSNFESVTVLKLIISLAFICLGIFLISARYGLKINIENNSYTVYTYILGFKAGQPTMFNYIEKFYINQVTEKALATTRTGAKFDVKNTIFKAFIKLDNGEKIHLDTDNSEIALEKRVADYRKSLKSIYKPIED